jgi:hypothetical protein
VRGAWQIIAMKVYIVKNIWGGRTDGNPWKACYRLDGIYTNQINEEEAQSSQVMMSFE